MDIGDERCGGYCKGDNLMKNINKRDSAIYSCFFVLIWGFTFDSLYMYSADNDM